MNREIITSSVKQGSFKFPIEFELFGQNQQIENATFDTGCAHSLISFSSLVTDKDVKDILEDILYDADSVLSIGLGVESSYTEVSKLREIIKDIEQVKKEYRRDTTNDVSLKNKIDYILSMYDNAECTGKQFLTNSKNLRALVTAKNYSINGLDIGNAKVRMAFNTENKNLIGMHLIRRLTTKIFDYNNEIHIVAVRTGKNADTLLEDAILDIKYADILDDDNVLESNYIHKQIEQSEE